MSIQQAMNNMLMSAQLGAGLYAHSPAGKEAAEVRKLKADYTKTDKIRDEWQEPSEKGQEYMAEILTKKQTERAQRLYELRPTKENLKIASEEREAYENIIELDDIRSSEAKALDSLTKKIGALTERLSSFEKRKTLLKKKNRQGGKK